MLNNLEIDKDLVLGIDTSNYKTSVAVVDRKGNILFNCQQFLDVKKGERGLRQSEAFFQHEMKLPQIISEVLDNDIIRTRIAAVSCSIKPRPVEGSYMPVFLAGSGIAKVISSSLNVPYYEFTHQEGHIEAVKYYSELKDSDRLICFHFSGGTTEAVLVDSKDNTYELVGGTRDLAFGQVIDRVGVKLGYEFPAGIYLDNIASKTEYETKVLKKLTVNDGFINLSGIETQCQRAIEKISCDNENETSGLVKELFTKIADSILRLTIQLSTQYEIADFIYCGGVSSSTYIKKYLEDNFPRQLHACFGESKFSSDNAIGIALLGGKKIWL